MGRSKLRLVRETYIKVFHNGKVYYLKEKCYASDQDGFINTERITKETFIRAIQEGKRVEEVDFENARLNIKNTIEKVS